MEASALAKAERAGRFPLPANTPCAPRSAESFYTTYQDLNRDKTYHVHLVVDEDFIAGADAE